MHRWSFQLLPPVAECSRDDVAFRAGSSLLLKGFSCGPISSSSPCRWSQRCTKGTTNFKRRYFNRGRKFLQRTHHFTKSEANATFPSPYLAKSSCRSQSFRFVVVFHASSTRLRSMTVHITYLCDHPQMHLRATRGNLFLPISDRTGRRHMGQSVPKRIQTNQ